MRKEKKYLPFWIAVIVVVLFWFILFLKPQKRLPPKVVLGKIALVLDDWGYTLNNLKMLEEINAPVTIAVLPNLAYSRYISQRLSRLNFEIILHLPMEPKEKMSLEKKTIKTTMSEEEILRIINDSLRSLDKVKGVSNHMGSKVTSNEKTLEIILRELKKRRLFFLDSYVTASSQVKKVAAKVGIKCARRDVFLDNSNDPAYILSQLQKLKKIAREKGYAIGIGHDRKNTLVVLKEEIPKIEKEGYRFVFVSELAN